MAIRCEVFIFDGVLDRQVDEIQGLQITKIF
jgi:hypothetical protein